LNILSLISFFNAYSFVILGVYILTLDSEKTLKKLAAIVNFCFAIWAFSYTFFYTAPTASSAMLLHRMSSVGWILFCPFTTHFFLVLSDKTKIMKKNYWYAILYALPTTLVLKSIFTTETPIAKGLVQSKIGLGWTYVSNIESIWYWLYVIHILLYFGVAMFFIYKWAKKSKTRRYTKQAKVIILLNFVIMCIGVTTDLVIPAISPMIPPFFNLLSIFWGIGFLYLIKAVKLMSVNDEETSNLILRTVSDPIIMLDSMGIITKYNQATQELLKYSVEDIIDKPLLNFCIAKKYTQQQFDLLLEANISNNVEIDLVDYYGEIINTLASISVVENKLDGVFGIVLNIHDITKLKRIEDELSKGENKYKQLSQHFDKLENYNIELYKRKEKYKDLSIHFNRLANYDMLTNLPNRRLLFNKLELALENYKISGLNFALGFIDLEGFQKINDSFGHDIGDLLLVKASKMFVASVRNEDIIARIGGHEFVIVFFNLQKDIDVDHVIKRIKNNFHKSIVIENCICPIGISIGISKCPEDGTTADKLMKIADERMYESKMVKVIK